jgi:hypothetical protein
MMSKAELLTKGQMAFDQIKVSFLIFLDHFNDAPPWYRQLNW